MRLPRTFGYDPFSEEAPDHFIDPAPPGGGVEGEEVGEEAATVGNGVNRDPREVNTVSGTNLSKEAIKKGKLAARNEEWARQSDIRLTQGVPL